MKKNHDDAMQRFKSITFNTPNEQCLIKIGFVMFYLNWPKQFKM